jgi:hypothetical protein
MESSRRYRSSDIEPFAIATTISDLRRLVERNAGDKTADAGQRVLSLIPPDPAALTGLLSQRYQWWTP